MHSIYLLAHRRRRREREETISSSTSSSTGAAPLCHANTLIELVLDVPRNDVPGGDVPGSDIAATAPWEGRAPARPRVQHPCATPTLSSSWCSTFPGTTFPEVTSPGATSPPQRPGKDEHQLVHGVQHRCATPTLTSS